MAPKRKTAPAAEAKAEEAPAPAPAPAPAAAAQAPASPVKPAKKARGPAYLPLTSHPSVGTHPLPIHWGARDPRERGPVLCSARDPVHRNAIGAHGGSYCVYSALAVTCGDLNPDHRPDFTLTAPSVKIGPHPSWSDPEKIVTIDPWGHVAAQVFAEEYKTGLDIRPTIAVTKAHIEIPEITAFIEKGMIKPDGVVLMPTGQIHITKAAVEPVWYLPGLAKRLGVDERQMRQDLFHVTGGMYPELVTRPDMSVFLPPIGGISIYMFGDVTTIADPNVPLTVRIHDECNGSDVFGSDICTCRPYLVHGIEECIKTAQTGGAGLIVYFRKEGRALGEVTKYLVYNLRKRQEGGDTAARYFDCTAAVAGVEDMRFQKMMPDALHWLGITKIHNLVSMSDMKYNAIVESGIEVVRRVPIPKERIPADAHVEIDAKVFVGYHAGDVYHIDKDELAKPKGRTYDKSGLPTDVLIGGGAAGCADGTC